MKRTKTHKTSAILGSIASILLIAAMLVVSAFAEDPPISFEKLDSTILSNPSRVVVDEIGTIYYASKINQTVTAISTDAGSSWSKTVAAPLSLAISSTGKLLAGSEDGNIYAVSASEVKTFVTVGYPASIGFGLNDELFVLDTLSSSIKVFSPEGVMLRSFGSAGDGNGEFFAPSSIAVNDNILFVLDKGGGTVYVNGTYTQNAPRIQVFNLDGTFIESFGTYGLDDGLLVNPSAIATDEANRVYVSDITAQIVQAFTQSGEYLTTIFDPEEAFNTPVNLHYSNKKLYVISYVSRRMDVFGVSGEYTNMQTSPGSLEIQSQICAPILSEDIVISNLGPGDLQWEVSSESAWLAFSNTGGTIEGNSSGILTVNVDSSGLPLGNHEALIEITAPGAYAIISVTMSISAPPTLSVNPLTLEFEYSDGDPAQLGSIEIMLDGDIGGEMQWQASSDTPWLGVSPSTGPSNAIVLTTVNAIESSITELPSGAYSATITTNTSCSEVEDISVPVSLTYVKGGTIEIITNLESASYTITGPETFTGSGLSRTFTAVTEGLYHIEFSDEIGYLSPEDMDFSVTQAEKTTIEVEYIDLKEANSIIVISDPNNSPTDDEMLVYDGNGDLISAIDFIYGVANTSGSTDAYTAAGDVDGDGVDEIIISHKKGYIYLLDSEGTLLGSIKPFPYSSNVPVAAGDINGDGIDEIIAGGGSENGDDAYVVLLGYTDGELKYAAYPFIAYKEKFGVKVAAGDIDGDGTDEIITTRGGRGKRLVNVRYWKLSYDINPQAFETAIGIGRDNASAKTATTNKDAAIKYPSDDDDLPFIVEAGSFSPDKSYDNARVCSGDLDADGTDEVIITRLETPSSGSAWVEAYSAEGTLLVSITGIQSKALECAAGDLDLDGIAEIVITESPSQQSSSQVRIYSAEGILTKQFSAFNDEAFGMNVTLGMLDQDN